MYACTSAHVGRALVYSVQDHHVLKKNYGKEESKKDSKDSKKEEEIVSSVSLQRRLCQHIADGVFAFLIRFAILGKLRYTGQPHHVFRLLQRIFI